MLWSIGTYEKMTRVTQKMSNSNQEKVTFESYAWVWRWDKPSDCNGLYHWRNQAIITTLTRCWIVISQHPDAAPYVADNADKKKAGPCRVRPRNVHVAG